MGGLSLLHSGDFHFGLERYGEPDPRGINSRVIDFERTLDRFVKEVLARDVAMAVLAGDTFHTRRPGPYELAVVARACRLMADAGTTIIVDPGNHDGMSTIGHADTHTLRWLDEVAHPNLHVMLKPGVTTLDVRGAQVRVAHMPYPHKRAFDDELAGVDPDDVVVEAGRRVENLIRAYADAAKDVNVPSIFVGHISVAGSVLASEQAMRMGWDVSVSAEAFDGFDYAALGHIHRQQRLSAKAWYAGSPDPHAFEDADPKLKRGFLHVTVEPGRDPVVEVVPSGHRKMGVLPLTQKPDGSWPSTGPAAWYADGPIIRVVLIATADRPPLGLTEDIVRDLRNKGASYAEVVVDTTQLPEQRARVDMRVHVEPSADGDDPANEQPTIGGFVGPSEALRRWLEANGQPLEPTLTVGNEIIGHVLARQAEQ